LVLVVLVFVYPLRMVTSSGLHLLTAGWVPRNSVPRRGLAARPADGIHGVRGGFRLLAWLAWRLNAHCAATRGRPRAGRTRTLRTRTEIDLHRIMTATAASSVALSLMLLAMPPPPGMLWLVGAPMWTYAVMGVVLGLHGARRERGRAQALAHR
jgi:hypothetical protein